MAKQSAGIQLAPLAKNGTPLTTKCIGSLVGLLDRAAGCAGRSAWSTNRAPGPRRRAVRPSRHTAAARPCRPATRAWDRRWPVSAFARPSDRERSADGTFLPSRAGRSPSRSLPPAARGGRGGDRRASPSPAANGPARWPRRPGARHRMPPGSIFRQMPQVISVGPQSQPKLHGSLRT